MRKPILMEPFGGFVTQSLMRPQLVHRLDSIPGELPQSRPDRRADLLLGGILSHRAEDRSIRPLPGIGGAIEVMDQLCLFGGTGQILPETR